jgi:hypothetical protein
MVEFEERSSWSDPKHPLRAGLIDAHAAGERKSSVDSIYCSAVGRIATYNQ